jgi:hypothetical protein
VPPTWVPWSGCGYRGSGVPGSLRASTGGSLRWAAFFFPLLLHQPTSARQQPEDWLQDFGDGTRRSSRHRSRLSGPGNAAVGQWGRERLDGTDCPCSPLDCVTLFPWWPTGATSGREGIIKTRHVLLIQVLFICWGLAAGYSALLYLRDRPTPIVQAPPRKTAPVVVAARDIPLGTVLGPEDVGVMDWPSAVMPRGFATAPEEVVGRTLIANVNTNEPILTGRLARFG